MTHPDPFETQLALVAAEMDDQAFAILNSEMTPREFLTHDIAQRLSGVLSELNYLIALSRDFDEREIHQAICAEEKDFLAVMFRAQLLCSFIEASKPQGLRLVRGKR